MKANPAREIIERLVSLGSHFDAASRGEIELCLGLGARPETISFGNTVKKVSDIAFALRRGRTPFRGRCRGRARQDRRPCARRAGLHPPDRHESQADWPLSRKFGCDGAMALDLMAQARDLGLDPVGISFHVGSQTRRSSMWAAALDEMARRLGGRAGGGP